MKKYIISLFLLFALLVCGTALAAMEVGTVISATNGAFALRDGSQISLAVKDRVMARDVLLTNRTGRMQVIFDDDSTIALATDTRIDLITVIPEGSPAFKAHVATGLARFITGKIVEQNPKGFNVTTPRGTVGIRGTIFAVQVTEAADTIFASSAKHGGVAVGTTGSALQHVPAGSKAVLRGNDQPMITPMTPGEANKIEQQVATGIGSGTGAVADATGKEEKDGAASVLSAATNGGIARDIQNSVLEQRFQLDFQPEKNFIGIISLPGASLMAHYVSLSFHADLNTGMVTGASANGTFYQGLSTLNGSFNLTGGTGSITPTSFYINGFSGTVTESGSPVAPGVNTRLSSTGFNILTGYLSPAGSNGLTLQNTSETETIDLSYRTLTMTPDP